MSKQDDLFRIQSSLNLSPLNSDRFSESIPFSLNDTTAGAENEFQTAVLATKENADQLYNSLLSLAK
ncbi:hypothetical protein MNBD_NITROSPINAE01-1882 [hydrothermal vent metagenome]|uniref:Uncharacterized protein n=1 Tax=hydrothermal vent metagenome TaxID=652676 RepID=A0A3B1BQK9_9ZZZZ